MQRMTGPKHGRMENWQWREILYFYSATERCSIEICECIFKIPTFYFGNNPIFPSLAGPNPRELRLPSEDDVFFVETDVKLEFTLKKPRTHQQGEASCAQGVVIHLPSAGTALACSHASHSPPPPVLRPQFPKPQTNFLYIFVPFVSLTRSQAQHRRSQQINVQELPTEMMTCLYGQGRAKDTG